MLHVGGDSPATHMLQCLIHRLVQLLDVSIAGRWKSHNKPPPSTACNLLNVLISLRPRAPDAGGGTVGGASRAGGQAETRPEFAMEAVPLCLRLRGRALYKQGLVVTIKNGLN